MGRLTQDEDVLAIDKQTLFANVGVPYGKHVAPNLKRIMVVSSPLWGPDSDGNFTVQVHESLNKQLASAMTASMKLTEELATWEAFGTHVAKWSKMTDNGPERS